MCGPQTIAWEGGIENDRFGKNFSSSDAAGKRMQEPDLRISDFI
jgi:hypothetical protein